MNRLSLILLLVTFGSLLTIESAAAVGVSVKPKTISLSIREGRPTTTEILVVNAGSQLALYQVYPDDFRDQLSVQPAEFELAPEATQLVKLTINVRRAGELSTNISIVARPLAAGGFSAATGVKVPISIAATGRPGWIPLVLGPVAALLLAIFVVKLKGRNKLNFDQ